MAAIFRTVGTRTAAPATNGFAPLKAGVRDEAIFAGPGIIKVRPGPADFLANPATITWGTIYTTCLMSRDEMMMDINLNSVSKWLSKLRSVGVSSGLVASSRSFQSMAGSRLLNGLEQ